MASELNYIAGNTNYDFEKADLKANLLLVEPLRGTAATTSYLLEAGMTGRFYLKDNGTAAKTLHICTALRASATAADTWAGITIA
jgi:hypothetical protein